MIFFTKEIIKFGITNFEASRNLLDFLKYYYTFKKRNYTLYTKIKTKIMLTPENEFPINFLWRHFTVFI